MRLPTLPHGGARLALQNLSVFFVTIAVLLGAGILSLPVKLVTTGFWPFSAVFTLTLVMQLAIIAVSCDLIEAAGQSLLRTDLHSLGRRYLPPAAAALFDALVLLTFVSTLISYALAGSKALVSLAGIVSPAAPALSSEALITPLVAACAAAIVFFEAALRPAIAAGTGGKVALLGFIIGIVGVVAHAVGLQPSSSWDDVMAPYLVVRAA